MPDDLTHLQHLGQEFDMADQPQEATRAELLPCPFCGGSAERMTFDEPGDNFGGDVICCTRCQASSHVEFGRKENLVSRWNTRLSPTPAALEETYACWQQKRGMLADRVDWAINEYDEFMKDDAFDSQRVLDRIVSQLRNTRDALREGCRDA